MLLKKVWSVLKTYGPFLGTLDVRNKKRDQRVEKYLYPHSGSLTEHGPVA